MAPQLWAEQLDAGAWGDHPRQPAQLGGCPRVRREPGDGRQRDGLPAAAALDRRRARPSDPAFEVLVWADSVRTVEMMQAALGGARSAGRRRAARRPGRGRRRRRPDRRPRRSRRRWTSARAIADSPHLRLAGVAGYEGALGHGVRRGQPGVGPLPTCETLVAVHRQLADQRPVSRRTSYPVVTAGGSSVLRPGRRGARTARSATVRASCCGRGAYVAHDDGFYRQLSPLGDAPADRRSAAAVGHARLGPGHLAAGARAGDVRRRQARPAVRRGTARGAAAPPARSPASSRRRCDGVDGDRAERPARLPALRPDRRSAAGRSATSCGSGCPTRARPSTSGG